MTNTQSITKIFISYATDDKLYKTELTKHLTALTQQGDVEIFDDSQIQAGTIRKVAIQQHWEAANIVLLLLSAAAFNDKSVNQQIEMAKEAAEKGEKAVIPILVRPFNYENLGITAYSALPSNHKPIMSWSNRDKAYKNIVSEIQKLIENRGKRKAKLPNLSKKNQPSESGMKSKFLKGVGGLSIGTFMLYLAYTAQITGYNVKNITNFFSKKQTISAKKIAYTVYIRNEEGDYITDINNHRKVSLSLDDNTISKPINDMGEANFRLEPKYLGQTATISIPKENDAQQPYRITTQDSSYTITENGKVNVIAKLDNTDKLFGYVKNFETQEALADVKVSVRNLPTNTVFGMTDAEGYFQIDIPKEFQNRKFHKVHLSKKGFQTEVRDSIHPHINHKKSIELDLKPQK